MSRVVAHMTMSLDGFVADPDDGVGPLFEWYDAGPVPVATARDDLTFHVDEGTARLLGGDGDEQGLLGRAGALLTGRRLFDLTGGWGGRHPIGAPVVVVSHRPPDRAVGERGAVFAPGVAEGVRQARELAGGRDVVVASADVARQALTLGLLDEVVVSLVPVVLGEGVAWFAGTTGGPHRLEDPQVVAGRRATHLRYAVAASTVPR